MSGFIDAHLHLWDRARLRYDWLDEAPGLPATFLPSDVGAQEGLAGVVVVEAGCVAEQGVDEVEWVAGLGWPTIRAMVGQAPIEDAAALDERLSRLAALPLVTAVRRMLQGEPAGWLESPEVAGGLRRVGAAGFAFDACVEHGQLRSLLALRRAAPGTTVVLDHLGKPPIARGWQDDAAAAWRSGINALAAEPSTFVKLSGVAPELERGPVLEQTRPFLEWALDAFGPDRTMAGSDWPVSAVPPFALGYRTWFDAIGTDFGLRSAERAAVLSDTAARVYRFDPVAGPMT